ncbi:unnamed protein product [Amoebophrya sp. A120]|nr:unnamed protein product [Amoebophrya sp. A120]|eukprot:GSA120T00005622001.1
MSLQTATRKRRTKVARPNSKRKDHEYVQDICAALTISISYILFT